MRTLALFVVLNLSTAASWAQGGYVRLTLSPGFHLLGNPLNHTNNNLNTILPTIPTSSRVFRFDPTNAQYVSATRLPTRWQPDLVFDPGEGFFLHVVAQEPVTFYLVGSVEHNNLTNRLVGGNALQLKSSILPLALPLGYPGSAGLTLEFPAQAGDKVFLLDLLGGYSSYTFNPVLGWLGPANNGGNGPVIPVASGFFLQRAGTGDWVQSRLFPFGAEESPPDPRASLVPADFFP